MALSVIRIGTGLAHLCLCSEWQYIDVRTLKPCDSMNVKNALTSRIAAFVIAVIFLVCQGHAMYTCVE